MRWRDLGYTEYGDDVGGWGGVSRTAWERVRIVDRGEEAGEPVHVGAVRVMLYVNHDNVGAKREHGS
jgi:hypothetical protein